MVQVNAARLRRQVASLFNETAKVEKVTRVTGSNGTWVETPVTITTGAPCRIAPLSEREIENGYRRFGEVTHAAVFDPGVELGPEYLVTDSRGRAFVVKWLVEPSMPEVYRKAIMYHRQPAP